MGPCFVCLVETVGHEDEESATLVEVDGSTDVGLCSTRLTMSFAVEKVQILFKARMKIIYHRMGFNCVV